MCVKIRSLSNFSDVHIFSSSSDEISSLNLLKVKPLLVGGGGYMIMMQTDNASIFTTPSMCSKAEGENAVTTDLVCETSSYPSGDSALVVSCVSVHIYIFLSVPISLLTCLSSFRGLFLSDSLALSFVVSLHLPVSLLVFFPFSCLFGPLFPLSSGLCQEK